MDNKVFSQYVLKNIDQSLKGLIVWAIFSLVAAVFTLGMVRSNVYSAGPLEERCLDVNNIVKNFNFECGKEDWKFYSNSSGNKFVVKSFRHSDGNAALIKINSLSKNIQLYQKDISLEPDAQYQLTFRARSNRDRKLFTYLHKHVRPYTNYGLSKEIFKLDSDWSEYQVTFNSSNFNGTVNDARLRFWFPRDNAKGDRVWIDDVRLEKVEAPQTGLNKKVYALIYDPILHSKGEVKLSEYKNWQPYLEQADDAINFFDEASDGYMKFSIAKTVEVNDVWLTKEDGFTYTEEEYLNVVDSGVPPHRPDIADYYQFLNDPQLDICGSLNRGEIDELWLFGGPWFGFYESAMASDGNNPGFWVNGPVYPLTSCEKLLPIGLPDPHSFGHRAEATMTHIYGGWEENRQDHRWDIFGLEGAHSPDFDAFGCGSVHYAPNSQGEDDDYDFDLPYEAVSYCDVFSEIPDVQLSDLPTYEKSITCTEWGCTTEGYEMWWWSHLPKSDGVGSDGKLNNWWDYIFDPNIIPIPQSGQFSNLSGDFPFAGPATFNFDYSGLDYNLKVNVSTLPDMSHDVYLDFAQGPASPIIEMDPQKWDKYFCTRTLYWQVISSTGVRSPITSTTVLCE